MQNWHKLSDYFDMSRRYTNGSGFESARTFTRMLYARWRYRLPAHMFGAFGLMTQPLNPLREFITGDERQNLLSAWAPQEWRYLEEDKLAFLERCRRSALPACPALTVISDVDSLCAKAMGIRLVQSASELAELFFQLRDIDGILKRTYGGMGIGIYPIEVRNGVVSPCHEYGSANELFEWLRTKRYRFSWIIQPKLRPHPELLDLMPGPGLGTVRINSFHSTSGQITLKWPILKLPAPGAVTDNWSGGGAGTIMVAVDIDTGRLGKAAGRPGDHSPVERFESHPGSKERITGRQLPHWNGLCRLVKSGASVFKELPALGWDVAITPDGPVLIEANWDFGLDMAQTMLGAGVRSELMMLLEEISS